MLNFLDYLSTLNFHELGWLQIKALWVTKSNLSIYIIIQLIIAQNDYDDALFFKERDSQCLQNQVNFSVIIVLRVKQDINLTVTLNSIFMRSKTSLFNANDTSAHLGKKFGGGSSQWTILMDYFLSCLLTRM